VDHFAARREHYRDFYAPCADASDRDLWLVVGNCQAEALRRVLDQVPDRPYRTARIPPVHELTDDDLPYLDVLLRQTKVLLSQPIRPDYRDLPIGTRQLAERLAPGAACIRWPVIRDAGLYPFQVIVRRPADRSVTPPVVPYHDLRTIVAARERRAPTEPWDVDVSAEQIRAVATISRDELAMRERRDCDVGISDVLPALGIDAAHTINHPGNAVFYALTRRILESAGLSPAVTTVDGVLLSSVTAPLEARVLSAHGLSATPRENWCQQGGVITPDTVHAGQLQWYSDNQDFIDLAEERHRMVMDVLGLRTPSRKP
jgi:hypothetical protein